MRKAERRVGIHVATVVVAVIGIGATLGGFFAARSSVNENESALLRDDTGQGAYVVGQLLSQLQAPVAKLASTVSSAGPDVAQFDSVSQSLVSSRLLRSVALVKKEGDTLGVVTSIGKLHRSFPSASPALLSGFESSHVQYTQVTPDGSDRVLGQLFGPGSIGMPAPYGVYAELVTPALINLSSIPGIPFSGVEGAVYLGRERPADLFLSTTRTLPLTGERGVAAIDASETYGFPQSEHINRQPGSVSMQGKLVLILRADTYLSGRVSQLLPWLILGLGAGATLLVDVVLALTLRRRDVALGLVRTLEAKNAELDSALGREAEAQDSLRRAQRMEAVGKLAGGIAHDFNNLLHVILSYASFLDDALEPGSELREDVAEVQNAARRAAELTRQLLVFSRRDVVRPEIVDVNALVKDSERLMRHTLGEDVVLTCLLSQEPCHVLADHGEIEQVLMNLAINARDAMPRGGSLAINVQGVDLSREQARLIKLDAGRYVRIDVIDTGTGMARDVASRAFEPFFTTKETGRGTGLGLAMVYGIVERWHGHVSLSSKPGVGTTVTLVLPMSDEELGHLVQGQGPAALSLSQERHPGASGKVLLVEDEPGVRAAGRRILERAGYEVLQAADAAEALVVFDSELVDVVVADVIMPGGISGKDLADELERRRPGIPVLYASGYGAEVVAERGVLPSSTQLLEKPFTAEALLDAVARALDPSSAVSR